MSLKKCALLTVALGFLLGMQTMGLLLPLAGIIQNLTDGNKAHVELPIAARIIYNPISATLIFAAAILLTFFSIRGAKREADSRAGWIIISIINGIAVLITGFYAFVVTPKVLFFLQGIGTR